MSSGVVYIQEGPWGKDFRLVRKPVKRTPIGDGTWGYRYPGQDEMGYGRKISTDYMVVIGKKEYRVYSTCFSNCESHWLTVNKQVYHLFYEDSFGEAFPTKP